MILLKVKSAAHVQKKLREILKYLLSVFTIDINCRAIDSWISLNIFIHLIYKHIVLQRAFLYTAITSFYCIFHWKKIIFKFTVNRQSVQDCTLHIRKKLLLSMEFKVLFTVFKKKYSGSALKIMISDTSCLSFTPTQQQKHLICKFREKFQNFFFNFHTTEKKIEFKSSI